MNSSKDQELVRVRRMRRVLPGFGLTIGFTLCYVSLLVLIPLSTVLLKSTTLRRNRSWSQARLSVWRWSTNEHDAPPCRDSV